MDRKALLLYLQNVRDLEVARNIVGNDYNRDKRVYESRINEKQSGIKIR